MSEREVRELRVLLEGTHEELDQAAEAIQRALCPGPDHEGFCDVPWALYGSKFADLGDEEKSFWAVDFDDRQKAGGE